MQFYVKFRRSKWSTHGFYNFMFQSNLLKKNKLFFLNRIFLKTFFPRKWKFKFWLSFPTVLICVVGWSPKSDGTVLCNVDYCVVIRKLDTVNSRPFPRDTGICSDLSGETCKPYKNEYESHIVTRTRTYELMSLAVLLLGCENGKYLSEVWGSPPKKKKKMWFIWILHFGTPG